MAWVWAVFDLRSNQLRRMRVKAGNVPYPCSGPLGLGRSGRRRVSGRAGFAGLVELAVGLESRGFALTPPEGHLPVCGGGVLAGSAGFGCAGKPPALRRPLRA